MSKREQEKAIDATKQVAEYMRNATAKRFQESINTSLDETKENVKKSLNETRSQIPRYTNVVKNYQEQALESTGKTVENYLEAQKSIINSVFDSVAPYYENVNRMYSYWLSPRVPAEIWARSVSNIAENISAAARTYNDILFGNIDAFGNAFERAQRQTEELTRINVNNAKTIANTAKEAAAEFSNNREVYR
jgi:inorganic triphosphatase YgiF